MSSNVKSNIWLCNLVMPDMAKRGGGSVIIISSIGGLRGSTTIGMYGVSKAADFALARNIAVEWGAKNVRANCVAPGLVKTDFARALWQDEKALKPRLAATPLRRIRRSLATGRARQGITIALPGRYAAHPARLS